MKEEYDFSNAEQGKFYVRVEDIQLPIYLDQDVIQYLNEKCLTKQENLQSLSRNRFTRLFQKQRQHPRSNP